MLPTQSKAEHLHLYVKTIPLCGSRMWVKTHNCYFGVCVGNGRGLGRSGGAQGRGCANWRSDAREIRGSSQPARRNS